MDKSLEEFAENKIDGKVREKWFDDIKEQYIKLRVEERDRIVSYFDMFNKNKTENKQRIEQTGFSIEKVYGFKGRGKNYSNWLGIDVIVDRNIGYYISLQAFVLDKKTLNHHIAMDRIGVYKYHPIMMQDYEKTKSKKSLETKNALIEMQPLNMYLPLNDDELSTLLKYIVQANKSNKRDAQNNIEKTKKEIDNMNEWINNIKQ